MKSIRVALATLALIGLTVIARAEVPPIIRFQGVLTDDAGVPLNGESVELTFGLFDAAEGGSQVWTQRFVSVPVRNGFYEVDLGTSGSGAPQTPSLTEVSFDRPYFLEISVRRGSQSPETLQPRKPLGSVAYSFRSRYADGEPTGSDGDSVAVLLDGGLELRRPGGSTVVELGIAPMGVRGSMVEESTLTASKIAAREVVTSVAFSPGVGGPDVDLKDRVRIEAGSNIILTTGQGGNSVRLSAELIGGGGGDVDSVNAGDGLIGGNTGGPEVDLWVGQGTGILVEEDSVSVDARFLAGDGLTTDLDRTRLAVNPGSGLEIVEDSLKAALGTGLRFDGGRVAADSTWSDIRYPIRDEANSIGAGMIVPDLLSRLNGIRNDGGNIDLVGEGSNVVITPDSVNHQIRIAVAGGGGGGVESVAGGVGLTATNPNGPNVTLDVVGGTGIIEFADSIGFDVAWGNNQYLNEGQPASVTAEMFLPEFVGRLDGVGTHGGNIDLIAGTNIAITPDSSGKTIRFDATGGGGVLSVAGGVGLTASSPNGPNVTLNVVGGTGIAEFADSIRFDIAWGNAQYVNEGQLTSITTGMIVPNLVSSLDGVSNDGGNIDLVAGSSNITIVPNDTNNTITLNTVADGNSLNALDGIPLDAVQVDSIGRVGVNATAPQATLHVRQLSEFPNGGIRIESIVVPDFWETFVDPVSNYSFAFNGVPKAWIESSSGQYVQALAREQGGEPVGAALQKVMDLTPVTYQPAGSPAESPASIGLAAEDVAAAFPQLVHQRDGLTGVDYSRMSVVAIRAIQEQQEMIDAQRREIDGLRRLVALQEERLANLERGR